MYDLKQLKKKLDEDVKFVEDLKNTSSKEELLKKLKTAGFELSVNDLEEVIKMFNGLELSENDLEGASSGIRGHRSVMF